MSKQDNDSVPDTNLHDFFGSILGQNSEAKRAGEGRRATNYFISPQELERMDIEALCTLTGTEPHLKASGDEINERAFAIIPLKSKSIERTHLMLISKDQ
eukprot:629096-Amorphochlora_amoeboformis.AAC.1